VTIHIQGASEHNLRAVDVEFGTGLTVVTGVSGSGKTSLVFDTLYHEARRRFLEIFSLGSTALRMSPAEVQSITGLGPAMAVGQNLLNRNPNSTLATASGLHPLLRLLFARFGVRHCPRCDTGLTALTEDEIIDQIASVAQVGCLTVSAPLLRQVQGSHRALIAFLEAEFGRGALTVDGRPYETRELDAHLPHDIDVLVASLRSSVPVARIREAVQTAGALGAQAVVVRSEGHTLTLARAPVCTTCGTWFRELEPVHFHTPCPHCEGAGCPRCGSTGLDPWAAAVRWHDLRLPDLLALPVDKARSLFAEAVLPPTGARLLSEMNRRLEALHAVGLSYVSLDRPSPTLSRGEAQRVRLAVTLTGRLEDMLHVLDEPTIGQHPADVARLLPAFRELAGPVVYVEHDRLAAAYADLAIDLGPGAGTEGGRLLFAGTPSGLWRTGTPTGRFFSLRQRVSVPEPRPSPQEFLRIRGAHLHNLQDIDVSIPTGRLTVITGVSGSGKSTLAEDVLVPSLAQGTSIGCQALDGPPLKPLLVDQNPIGRNPRSNPATYTGLASIIRNHYAMETGLSSSHFSFNRPEGACPACKGMGATEVRMRYLPSTWIPCAACGGQRFSDQMLSARISFAGRSLSIADLYRLSVAEVIPLLLQGETLTEAGRRGARRILESLRDVGLGYLSLGQPSPSLSGGEAQRVKLTKALGRRSLTQRLLVLDEPSTGLHPQDIAGLLTVLDRLVRAGATVVVVEHNPDMIRAADWVIDLGPGAGPAGGRVVYTGPPGGLLSSEESITGQALRDEASLRPRSSAGTSKAVSPNCICIRGAQAHNLKDVDVDFPKAALTVVTGVSGSGKSSLVADVLEAEARRRFLETLSLYERQGTREGPEAEVRSLSGLGVAITVGPERRLYERRATVGTATEIQHHLAVLLALVGERGCLECGAAMRRVVRGRNDKEWLCTTCGATAPIAEPRHFSPSNYAAACLTCHGVGTLQVPRPEKLIIHPERPICGGAMYSPGFFPRGYLCKPFNGGYDMVQALAARYEFDPAATPWDRMTPEARRAFLFGDPEPIHVTHHSRTGRTHTHVHTFPGFYGWVRDWDVGGTYTEAELCPDCQGARLRPAFLAVTLAGHSMRSLSEMPLSELLLILESISLPAAEAPLVEASLHAVARRLRFLVQVGLGYLHLDRVASTLSAGEAQRVKLAGLLGSGLTYLTVLLDEPSRGLHPSEVQALLAALQQLRDEGNTVIVVEHDPVLIHAADHLIDMGPGAGNAGGRIVAEGRPEEVARTGTLTALWLRGERRIALPQSHREPRGWLTIRGARANNLCGETIRLPLGTLTGVCGVSGSGKSTLLIDTIGRVLAPKKQTTSVAREPLAPGAHEAMEGAPARAVLVDQGKAGVHSPASYLGLVRPLQTLYAASDDAQALGLGERELSRRCSACKGTGSVRMDMGFLPDVHVPCETCRGTGYTPEAWEVHLRGVALPDLFALTIDEVYDLFRAEEQLARPLAAARDVGLGYLVLRQPGYALSGGEAQRLKIARELCRRASGNTLYILDEPTVGQHMEDVARLTAVLHRLVDRGHSVSVIEHHPHLLATCDWLLEFGPGGGPDGGRLIAAGTPETLASGETPTAPFLREILEAR
jgi:excinuclease ABC subunit A